MSSKNSNYHRFLRISAVVCAVALVFESGLLVPSTEMLAQNTHLYLANAVGMSAGVAPTELNQYTAQLTKKERDLDAREAALKEREIDVSLSTQTGQGTDTATYLLASVLFILLVLILLNYTLDYLRLKERSQQQTV